MHIAIVAPIATEDLLPLAIRKNLDYYPKGYEGAPLISVLINEYVSRGHKILAITTGKGMGVDEPPFIYESDQLTFIVVPNRKHTFRYNGRYPGRAIDFFRIERLQIVHFLKLYQPDVVHAHWAYEYSMAALQYTPNAVVTIHDDPWVVLKYVKTPYRFFRLLMAQYVFWKGNNFTTVSPYLAKAVQKWIKPKIQIVPNPLLLPVQPSSKREKAKIISLIMNGWDKRKNGEKALLAFKIVLDKYPDSKLWAMGTAFERNSQAEKFCIDNKINNVVFWGKLSHTQILNNLTESYLLLHTSLEESFGMVLVESLSIGIPVVAGKYSGAVPWVVQEGGILVDVRNTEEIAEAVCNLLTDVSLYSNLSYQGKENVIARFSVDSVAKQFIELYQTYAAHNLTLNSYEN